MEEVKVIIEVGLLVDVNKIATEGSTEEVIKSLTGENGAIIVEKLNTICIATNPMFSEITQVMNVGWVAALKEKGVRTTL